MRSTLGVLVAGVIVAELAGPAVRAQRARRLLADAVAFEQHPPQPTARVLVLGDSTGVGTGASMPGGSLAGHLGRGAPHLDVTNRARNGLHASELLADLRLDLPHDHELVIVHIGGNDILQGTDLTETAAAIAETVELLLGANGVVVLFTTGDVGQARLIPRGLRGVIARRALRLQDLLDRTLPSDARVTHVDLFDPAADLRACDGHSDDGLHPNDRGYGVWFGLLRRHLPAEVVAASG